MVGLPQDMLGERYSLLRYGGAGAGTTLICGVVRFDHPAAHPLLALLPRVIHLDSAGSPHMEWMQSTLRLMAAEARELLPGGETVITVARWRMHVALNSLKEEKPALGELASRLGYQSEAAFSRAFKRYIGISPGAVRRNPEGASVRASQNIR
ncbi:AraC family transcriptional regulator [Cystobacter ferrugineus]|uniref:HTH araC/xylS-type domain-containing protein n=1 Tax=Cystobacter ferrugineus TaxID=83449 RepID=A0A1L9AVW6_9BACT|nr:cupin domain-containing protein [Cystobacter ferrugineus]OJH34152.1 hypothetical protein BON30_45165 [Cystobacter ferrugineus]